MAPLGDRRKGARGVRVALVIRGFITCLDPNPHSLIAIYARVLVKTLALGATTSGN